MLNDTEAGDIILRTLRTHGITEAAPRPAREVITLTGLDAADFARGVQVLGDYGYVSAYLDPHDPIWLTGAGQWYVSEHPPL